MRLSVLLPLSKVMVMAQPRTISRARAKQASMWKRSAIMSGSACLRLWRRLSRLLR